MMNRKKEVEKVKPKVEFKVESKVEPKEATNAIEKNTKEAVKTLNVNE